MKTDHLQNAVQVDAELSAFAEHFNYILKDDPEVKHILPLAPLNLISAVADGILLAKLINFMKPGTINESSLIRLHEVDATDPNADKKQIFNVTANVNLVMEATQKIGLRLVNIGSNDIIEGNQNMILAFIWQLIRHHVLISVNLKTHPELIRLLHKNEGIDMLISLTPEQILLRWFNYHLGRDECGLKISNFSSDLVSGKAFLYLMRQIDPRNCSDQKYNDILENGTDLERIELVLHTAELMKSRCFASTKTIVAKATKLNLAFTATLFNNHIGIHLPSEDEIREILNKITDLEAEIARLEQQIQESEKERMASASAREAVLLEQIANAQNEATKAKKALEYYKKEHQMTEDSLISIIYDSLDAENNMNPDAAAKTRSKPTLQSAIDDLIQSNNFHVGRSNELIASLQRTKDLNDLISSKIVEVSEELIKYRAPLNSNPLKKKSNRGGI